MSCFVGGHYFGTILMKDFQTKNKRMTKYNLFHTFSDVSDYDDFILVSKYLSSFVVVFTYGIKKRSP